MPDSPRLNIKLILAYDGTRYFGWQKTPTGPSIEAAVQATLEQIVRHPVHIQAASRTDAGVHAKGQVVNFILERDDLDLKKLWISVNRLLPKDISVLELKQESSNFHPTLDCIGKEYLYQICYAPVQIPQARLYEWHYHHPLDVELMRESANILCGEWDFAAFTNRKKNEAYRDHIRQVEGIDIDEPHKGILKILVRGNHFLYKMVRNIVGSLVYVGAGKISMDQLPTILKSKDRSLAGMTAPAHGLTLQRIMY